MTLIDTLDTLAVSYLVPDDSFFAVLVVYFFILITFVTSCFKVLGEIEEFEEAVRLVIKDVSFDNDVVVSVFETNIRVLG